MSRPHDARRAHMALNEYKWRGYTWQFADGEAPADAEPVKAKQAKAPANKARRAPAKKQA